MGFGEDGGTRATRVNVRRRSGFSVIAPQSRGLSCGMKPYHRIVAWKRAHEFATALQLETRAFPADERYGLTSQLRRAAFSVAANIVEGSGKRGVKEFGRFLDIALGSMLEVTYALEYARDVGYLSADRYEALEQLRNEAGILLWALYKKVRGPRPR